MDSPPNLTNLHLKSLYDTFLLWATGTMVGMGQLLTSTEPLSWRRIAGRALVSGGLGASSSAVMLWLPDMPFPAYLGLAAALSSVGVAGVEKLLTRVTATK
jgi:hypothetical protein